MSVPHEARPFRRCAISPSPTTNSANAAISRTTRRRSTACTSRPSSGATGWRPPASTATAPTTSRRRTSRKPALADLRALHQGVFEVYAKSVHGDPRKERRRARVHRLPPVARRGRAARRQLAEAHAGAVQQLPREQGADGQVRHLDGRGDTYVADFHGMTASLQGSGTPRAASVVALCTDCHGVHDIAKVNEPGRGAPRQPRQNCARCHEGASDNFRRLDVALRAELGESPAGLRRAALL